MLVLILLAALAIDDGLLTVLGELFVLVELFEDIENDNAGNDDVGADGAGGGFSSSFIVGNPDTIVVIFNGFDDDADDDGLGAEFNVLFKFDRSDAFCVEVLLLTEF